MTSDIKENSLVSLGMYDFPEIQDVVSDWVRGLGKAYHSIGLEDFPLDPSKNLEGKNLEGKNLQGEKIWLDPGLLLSQTCGYPLVSSLKDQVRLIATPTYNVRGCEGAFYSSPIIVRRSETGDSLEDFKDRVFAFNALNSQSGYNGINYKLAQLTDDRPFFSSAVETGSHQKSIETIAESKADIASIDCVSWSLFNRYLPDLTRSMKIVGWTDRIPGLPLITRGSASDALVEKLRHGLYLALEDPSLKATRQALMINGAENLDFSDYRPIAEMIRYIKMHGGGIER